MPAKNAEVANNYYRRTQVARKWSGYVCEWTSVVEWPIEKKLIFDVSGSVENGHFRRAAAMFIGSVSYD